MSKRVWFYQQMVGDSTLMAKLPGGIHSSTALEIAPQEKPFVMYRNLSHRPGEVGDDTAITKIEVYLVHVHDVPGDYLRINSVLADLLRIFEGLKDKQEGVGRCTWVEDSEDFRDEDMGTILRYARIEVRYLP